MSESPARVFVGMPAYRGMEIHTAASDVKLVFALNGSDVLDGRWEIVGIGLNEGYGAARNSEECAHQAMQQRAEVLLHHDADMRFTPDDVARLLETWDRLGRDAVVGAMYPASRGGPLVGRLYGVPTVNERNEPDDLGVFTPRDAVEGLRGQVLEADSLGFGFIAIPTHHLRTLVEHRGYAFEETTRGRHASGNDSPFCAEARRRGWRMAADLGCSAQHLQRTWE